VVAEDSEHRDVDRLQFVRQDESLGRRTPHRVIAGEQQQIRVIGNGFDARTEQTLRIDPDVDVPDRRDPNAHW
jgi:hypothetical protein